MSQTIYQKLKKYSKILKDKEIYPILNEIISDDYSVASILENDKGVITLRYSNGENQELEILGNQLIFTKSIGDTMIQKDFLNPIMSTVQSITLEKRPYGLILMKTNKNYDYTKNSPNEKELTELETARYVFGFGKVKQLYPYLEVEKNNMAALFTRLIGTNTQIYSLGTKMDFLGIIPDVTTYFETHVNKQNLISNTNTKPNKNLSNLKAYTIINLQDVTDLYGPVQGKGQIARIYDLYNGIINERNIEDINMIHQRKLSEDVFDLKTAIGITEQEESIVGSSITPIPTTYYEQATKLINDKFYNKCTNLSNRDELLQCIKRTPSSNEIIRYILNKELGLPDSEIDKLDFEEQQKLLTTVKKDIPSSKKRKKIFHFKKK